MVVGYRDNYYILYSDYCIDITFSWSIEPYNKISIYDTICFFDHCFLEQLEVG